MIMSQSKNVPVTTDKKSTDKETNLQTVWNSVAAITAKQNTNLFSV